MGDQPFQGHDLILVKAILVSRSFSSNRYLDVTQRSHRRALRDIQKTAGKETSERSSPHISLANATTVFARPIHCRKYKGHRMVCHAMLTRPNKAMATTLLG